MLPVFLMCAAITITLFVADLLSKAGAEPGSLQADDRGFVDSEVRCEAPQSAVAFGRTEQSLVAICVDRDGHYEYRGARLGDDAVLTVVAEPTVPGVLRTERRCHLHSHRKGTPHQVGRVRAHRADASIRVAAAAGGGGACVEAPLAGQPGDPVTRQWVWL